MNSKLVDLIPEYKLTQQALGRRPTGIDRYVRTLKAFAAWVGTEARVSDFNKETVLRFRDSFGERGAAGSTVINTLAALNSFAEWLIERGQLQVNPTVSVARPKKKGPDPQPLSIEQVVKLMRVIEHPREWMPLQDSYKWNRNRRVVFLALFAGLRLNEIRELRWGNCVFDEETPVLKLRDGVKGGKPRRVAIHPDLLEELLKVPESHRRLSYFVCGHSDGKGLSRGGMEHIFDRWLEHDLNIDDVLGVHLHAHKLRTTFASHFMWSGGDILTLQSIMGHKDLGTLRRYVLPRDIDQLDGMVQLPYGSRRENQ